ALPISTPEDTMEVTMQDKTTIHDDLQFSEQATLHDTLHDNPQIINLLNILQEEGEISRDYLLTKLDLNDRSNLRNSYLKPALKADLIELTLPEKLKSKKQKYRLTEKGKTFLKNIQVTPEVTPEATMQDKTAIHNDLQVSDQITMQDTMQVTPEATMQDKIAIHDDLQISDQITMQDTMQVAPKTTMQDKTTIDDVLQFSDQITMQVEIQMQKFLESCLKEKNREELQDAIGLKNRDYFRKKYLNPAVEAGLLALTIPDKPNSKHQKYRLTEKGKMFLKNRTKQHE
ncbi:MAG: ATP-dependent helicase RecG, partial [Acidobacteriota bacterium]|nr:ATP-dependent helicase RecG [Acidobacteriota bacterium]